MQNGTKYKKKNKICVAEKGERNEKKKMQWNLFFNAISHDGDFVVDLSGVQCIQ